MIPDLENRVNDLKASRDAAAHQQQLEEQAWDLGMCPHCGSNKVKETSFHELSGTPFYKCHSCGRQGEGESML